VRSYSGKLNNGFSAIAEQDKNTNVVW